MTAGTVGQFVGFTLACGGVAYIWLAIMWATRVHKHAPRFAVWSAAGVGALIGVNTALSNPDSAGIYLLGTAVAVAFVLYRGAGHWGKKKQSGH